MSDVKNNGILMYKGKPLIRKDNLLYYGFFDDSHIIMMQVMESKEEKDAKFATRVRVELQSTDPNVKYRDRVLKKTEKPGLFTAMDVASVWLERALTSK
ncbi:MAG: hypothetical protein IKM13_02685 [Clostridia bacterium]|nr:hypothetical protein [Oscillospiraceae bacterium]MBQ6991015.1 hypothetical protein [Clostridia bacterium]MBR6762638.1 hypothetical protein [Clostridia bacterium]